MIIEKIDKCQIDVVNGCNLRCIGCPNSTLKPVVKFISEHAFEKILGNIDVSKIRILRLFNFGEPMLHPELPKILEVIARQKFSVGRVEISTNATIVNKEQLRAIFSTGLLDFLAVSCDGNCNKKSFEKLRPPAKWETMVEFLAVAKLLRDKYSPKTELVTRTICDNSGAKKEWTQFLSKLGWRPTFRSMRVIADAKIIEEQKPDVPNGVCGWLYNPKKPSLYVKMDGTVVPCCTHPEAFVIGNLKKQKFSDIYFSPERMTMIKKMKHDRKSIPVCNQCEEL